LHDFAELLMWCHAPDLMQQVRQAQQRDPALRSVLAQRSLLNVELDDLRQALLRLWHLPRLLIRISDGKHADHPSVQNVVLASRLARHTMKGWDNPALGSDVEELSRCSTPPHA
jgi:HD-like signal output (HDOD) protein